MASEQKPPREVMTANGANFGRESCASTAAVAQQLSVAAASWRPLLITSSPLLSAPIYGWTRRISGQCASAVMIAALFMIRACSRARFGAAAAATQTATHWTRRNIGRGRGG